MSGSSPSPPPPVPEPPSTDRPLPRFHVRYARLRDIAGLIRLYRGRSEKSRRFYHPFPFGRGRLFAIFGWMIVARHFVRWMIRHTPGLAAILFVVEADSPRRIVGYGTLRYVAEPGKETWAKTGYVVLDEYQGLGLGRTLAYWLFRSAVATGMRTAGGPVVETNIVNIDLLAGLGLPAKATEFRDRGAPGERNVMVKGDTREALAGMNARGLQRGSSRALVDFVGTPPPNDPPGD